jgi:hypothetical protein
VAVEMMVVHSAQQALTFMTESPIDPGLSHRYADDTDPQITVIRLVLPSRPERITASLDLEKAGYEVWWQSLTDTRIGDDVADLINAELRRRHTKTGKPVVWFAPGADEEPVRSRFAAFENIFQRLRCGTVVLPVSPA